MIDVAVCIGVAVLLLVAVVAAARTETPGCQCLGAYDRCPEHDA